MISLANRIGTIAVVIRSPEQTGPCRGLLPFEIFRVALQARIRGFVDHTEDSLALHRRKIRPHHVVMREIHYAVGGKGARWNRKKQSRAAQHRQSHQHTQIAADISTRRGAFASGSFSWSAIFVRCECKVKRVVRNALSIAASPPNLAPT